MELFLVACLFINGIDWIEIMNWTVTYFGRNGYIVGEIDFSFDTEEEAIEFAELNSPKKATHYKMVNTELIN